MGKRYYLAPIVGTGTDADPYRAATADYNAACTIVPPPTGPDGRPLALWTLAIVGTVDHSALLADATLGPLPDGALDGAIAALSRAARRQLDDALAKFGLADLSPQPGDGYRDLLRAIGRRHQPGFDENRFDCGNGF